MSVVAVRVYPGSVEIAADSIGTCGETQEKNPSNKLFKIGDALYFGSTGKSSLGTLMLEHLTFHAPEKSDLWPMLGCIKDFYKRCREVDQNIDPESNSFIIVFHRKVWYVCGLHVKEITTFEAIGAGRDFALAAMYLGSNPKEACEVACELSTQCERPVVSHAF